MTSQTGWNSRYNSAKGSILSGDGTNPIVLPVGADNRPLLADSSTSEGLRYSTVWSYDDTIALGLQQATVTGGKVQYQVNNLDGTNASSNAELAARTEPGGGDAYITTVNAGLIDYTFGIAAADGNWKLGHGGAPSAQAGTYIDITAAGIISLPLQVAFTSRLNVTDANATGNGATYTFGQGGNLVITQTGGSNLSAAGVFTVPVGGGGFYHISGRIVWTGVAVAMDDASVFLIVNGTDTYYGDSYNAGAISISPTNTVIMSASFSISLTAGDTVELQGIISNGAGNNASAAGGAATTRWSGFSGTKIT